MRLDRMVRGMRSAWHWTVALAMCLEATEDVSRRHALPHDTARHFIRRALEATRDFERPSVDETLISLLGNRKARRRGATMRRQGRAFG